MSLVCPTLLSRGEGNGGVNKALKNVPSSLLRPSRQPVNEPAFPEWKRRLPVDLAAISPSGPAIEVSH